MRTHLRTRCGSRGANERGASAVEYGLLVAGIAAVIVAIVFALGSQVGGIFEDTTKKISDEATTPAVP